MARPDLHRRSLIASALATALVACGGGGGDDAPPPPGPAAPALSVLSSGLQNPWGLALLPDGHLLVTQRGGSLLRLSATGQVLMQIAGVPAVAAAGQGGLLDIALTRTSPPAHPGSTSAMPSPAAAARRDWPAPRYCAPGWSATRWPTRR